MSTTLEDSKICSTDPDFMWDDVEFIDDTESIFFGSLAAAKAARSL